MQSIDPEYLRRETWSLVEAAHILAGKRPVPRDSFDTEPATGGLPAHIYANLKDATDAFIRGELGDHVLPCEGARTTYIAHRRVRPWDVVQWAKRRGDNVPDVLSNIRAPVSTTVTSPLSVASVAPPGERSALRRSRTDLMSIEIDRAVKELGSDFDLATTMGKLRSYAGQEGSCITSAGNGYVLWRDVKGKPQKLGRDALRKRLARLADIRKESAGPGR